MRKNYFLITIDTEGDNFWQWDEKTPITTNNALFLSRFQMLCNEYGFKPTYLVNYEMAKSNVFIKFANLSLREGLCEIGMHLHAWNTDPYYKLDLRNDVDSHGLPYITEYPTEIIEKKVETMTTLIEKTFGVKPVSHRAGRWATNADYARILEKHGYKYDCSFTPGVSWQSCFGYSNYSFGNSYLRSKNRISHFYDTTILEIPLQGYKNKRLKTENIYSVKSFFKNLWYSLKRKQVINFRPNGKNIYDLLYMIKKNYKSKQNYLMFMLHSSEFMPGGSPTFKTSEDIDLLFKDLKIIFDELKKRNYIGLTIKQYGELLGGGDK